MKKTAKFLTAAGAAAVTAAAVAVRTVSEYAINPRSAVFKKNNSDMDSGCDGVAAETVRLKSCDGTVLVGHLVRAAHPERTVIAFHGWRSSWQHDFNAQLSVLDGLSCNVLYVDQRAQGASGGKYMGFGALERFDCLEWLKLVEAQNTQGLPVYLMGVSMGATTVMLASELIGSGRVNGIVADCGFTSAGDIWRYSISQKAKHGAGLMYKISDSRCRHLAGYGGDTRSASESLKNTDIPFLFFHGSEDRFVPTEMGYEVFESCASEKKLVITDGARHARSCSVDPERYTQELKMFFEKYDKSEKTEEEEVQ